MSVRARGRPPSLVFVARLEGRAVVETDSSAPESDEPAIPATRPGRRMHLARPVSTPAGGPRMQRRRRRSEPNMATAAAAAGGATGRTDAPSLKMTLRPRTSAEPAHAGGATRVLFPSAQSAGGSQKLAEEVSKIRQAKKDKWNFDFEANQPLPGAYEWTPVTPDKKKATTAATPSAPRLA